MDTDAIRSLNDRFRKRDPSIPGQTVITRGLWELTEGDPCRLLALYKQVADFDDFSPDSDPHQEHDFGSFEFEGQTCFWKIDYYDPTLTYGSDDPSDLSKTQRALTIMLAAEY